MSFGTFSYGTQTYGTLGTGATPPPIPVVVVSASGGILGNTSSGKRRRGELTEYEKMFVGLAKLQPHATNEAKIELFSELEARRVDEEDDVMAILLLM